MRNPKSSGRSCPEEDPRYLYISSGNAPLRHRVAVNLQHQGVGGPQHGSHQSRRRLHASSPKPYSGLGLSEILPDKDYADILTGGSRSSGSGHTYGFRLTRASWSAFALASNTSSWIT